MTSAARNKILSSTALVCLSIKQTSFTCFYLFLIVTSCVINPLSPFRNMATSNIKFPCGICCKSVAINHRAIQCDTCDKWIHIACNKLEGKDYSLYQKQPELVFECINCRSEYIPFCNLNDNQFDIAVSKGVNYLADFNLQTSLTPSQQSILDRIEIAVQDQEDNDDSDNDDMDINPVTCKYYSINEFIKLKPQSKKYFSIFHLNIHSIQRHIEELRILLQLINFNFDFLCISESKLEKGSEAKVDISIDGYEQPLSKPTEATKGGVLLYAREGIVVAPRTDLDNLMYKSKQLESIFVEVVGDSKSLVGIIYRHPCMNEKIFNDDYLKTFIKKIQSENKHCYISGDFNFDLINVSSHEATSEFFEIMMANLLIPCITLATKINRCNNTIIDNIFTNNIHPDSIALT